MAGPRKRYSSDLKAKIALEAIRGEKTANEIAAEYGTACIPRRLLSEKNKP